MSYKAILLAIIALFLGAFTTILVVKSVIRSQPLPEFHEHADFALFLNGKPFDFSPDKYMSTKPCTIDESPAEDADTNDVVHLHDLDGGVIHVHRLGVTYKDFFASLHMNFSDTVLTDDAGTIYPNDINSSFRFFVNGSEVPTIADRPIRDLDQVLITYGPRNRTRESINQELGQVSNRACISSHLCDHRGPVAEESCGASKPKPNPLVQWLGL